MAIRMNQEEAGCWLGGMGIMAIIFGIFCIYSAITTDDSDLWEMALYTIGGGLLALLLVYKSKPKY